MTHLGSIRNIGILAHVDAGKTTLTEQLLHKTGTIRSAGRVDLGTAHTDTLAVERARGISVRAQAACCMHRGVNIRIIDTPGHVDFSTEVESALLALDGAVLVVSAVEGVQAQTAVIARVLASLAIPTLVFLNKIDRAGADVPRVLGELRALMPAPLLLTDGHDAWLDLLTQWDEALLAEALDGDIPTDSLHTSLADACAARHVTPVLEGAALRGIGIEAALDAIVDFLPPPKDAGCEAAVVYHIARDGNERQAHVRVFGGSIGFGVQSPLGRVKRLRALTPHGYQNVEMLTAGDIGLVVGLDNLQMGDWLGEPQREKPRMAQPVLRAQAIPRDEAQFAALQTALTRMAEEWPDLSPRFEPRTRQIWVHVMGEIHQQIIEETLKSTHGVDATLSPPAVLYRETPCRTGHGSLDMFFAPWCARATFEVSPAPRGAGVRFTSRASTDFLYLKYQRDIESTVREALQEGLQGWPVDDIDVVLTDGQCTNIAHPGSRFGPVVPIGLFAALQDAGTQLMEPLLHFTLRAEAEHAPLLIYDLQQMRATHDAPTFANNLVHISGIVPVETSLQYATRLNGTTHGRGIWRTEFEGYAPCPPGIGAPIARTRPDPCNVDLFMKHVRGVM